MPLAVVRGKHQPLRTNYNARFQPLMVTSVLGRTGRTWVMHLLAQHPQIVARRNYPYENYSASYWIHMLKVLGEPVNHHQSSTPGGFLSDLWLLGHHPFHPGALTAKTSAPNRPLHFWFG